MLFRSATRRVILGRADASVCGSSRDAKGSGCSVHRWTTGVLDAISRDGYLIGVYRLSGDSVFNVVVVRERRIERALDERR